MTVKKHPEADSLYIEVSQYPPKVSVRLNTFSHQQIDLGEDTGPRTVVSGLVNYIPIEDMRDKYLVCIVGQSRHSTFMGLTFRSAT